MTAPREPPPETLRIESLMRTFGSHHPWEMAEMFGGDLREFFLASEKTASRRGISGEWLAVFMIGILLTSSPDEAAQRLEIATVRFEDEDTYTTAGLRFFSNYCEDVRKILCD